MPIGSMRHIPNVCRRLRERRQVTAWHPRAGRNGPNWPGFPGRQFLQAWENMTNTSQQGVNLRRGAHERCTENYRHRKRNERPKQIKWGPWRPPFRGRDAMMVCILPTLTYRAATREVFCRNTHVDGRLAMQRQPGRLRSRTSRHLCDQLSRPIIKVW